MTLRLAIDTATDLGSVALQRDGLLVAERWFAQRRHAAELVPAIVECLNAVGGSVHDVDEIVVADGPGSFTGLRIAFATVKGLIAHADRPVFTVPSLMAAAHLAYDGDGTGTIAALFDALRGEVFAAVYTFDPTQVVTHLVPTVITVDALIQMALPQPWAAVGDGATRYAAAMRQWTGRAVKTVGPHARALFALRGLHALQRLHDPMTCEPNYGRQAEAQVRWERKHGRPLPNSAS